MGADHVFNYKDTPDWGAAIKQQFGGADKVVEVGGVGTLQQSMQALANEGGIALIGVLSQGEPPSPHALMMTGGSIRGIFVGSVQMARDLNAFVDQHGIEPPMGGRFAFDNAGGAYAHAWGSDSFAKTVIELD